MVKQGAVCIDVGLSRIDGKLYRDFNLDNLKDYVSHISKAPGGVGPMTITSCLENTIECYLNQKKTSLFDVFLFSLFSFFILN